MGKRRLNLNNYTICSEEEATLEIVPIEINGIEQPTLYFKGKRKKLSAVTVEDIESGNATWTPIVKIDSKCSPDDYKKLVEWWFESATDEYRLTVSTMFSRIPDLLGSINNVRAWLLTIGAYTTSSRGKFTKRKSDLNRFMNGWLTRTVDKIPFKG